MSNFLVRLARRSAGVAPVLHPHWQALAMPLHQPVAETPMARDPAAPTLSDAPVRDAPIPVPPVSRISPESGAAARMPTTAASVTAPAPAAPLVQRSVFANIAPSAVASGGAHAILAAPVAAAWSPPRPAASMPDDATPPHQAHPAPLPATRIGDIHTERVVEVHEKAVFTRDMSPIIAAPAPIWPPLAAPVDSFVAPDSHATERKSAEARAPLASVTLKPAPAAADATLLPAAPAAESERMVHVHIGAIEIRTATPAPVAVAPPEATATAAPGEYPASAPAASASGFEAYADLRSYAPWTG
ncbi:hypothetical protein [Paraburkholderia youngii]|uniref:hypothetical protein n=1 Tax=Paraburkholderia youngii TaxID=2782701 RepID=UPI003D1A2D32